MLFCHLLDISSVNFMSLYYVVHVVWDEYIKVSIISPRRCVKCAVKFLLSSISKSALGKIKIFYVNHRFCITLKWKLQSKKKRKFVRKIHRGHVRLTVRNSCSQIFWLVVKNNSLITSCVFNIVIGQLKIGMLFWAEGNHTIGRIVIVRPPSEDKYWIRGFRVSFCGES